MQYEQWMQEAKEEAKRNVVRKALESIKNGIKNLPCALYFTFKTHIKGVEICASLKKKYPEEISIVLQEEFWNLVVEENFFSVDLIFDQKRQTIKVPFYALSHFIDEQEGFFLELDPNENQRDQLPDNVILFRNFLEKAPSNP